MLACILYTLYLLACILYTVYYIPAGLYTATKPATAHCAQISQMLNTTSTTHGTRNVLILLRPENHFTQVTEQMVHRTLWARTPVK